MQNHIKKHEIFEVAFKKCCELDLKFENAEKYNNALKYTFQRTFNDISQSGKELKILEIGSFTGVVSVALKLYGNFITATDMDFVINDPAIKQLFDEEAISGHSVNLANGILPFENECFDLIVFNEVLEHLNFNPIPTLREFHRILVRGGRVYCATPNLLAAKNVARIVLRKGYLNPPSDFIWNLEPGTGMSVGLHWREWSREELIELFKCAGFGCEWHKFGLVTPNRSKFPRNIAVKLMYQIFPSLMPNQVAFFQKV
jgi:SAM-dependent methyltransferase